MLRLAEEGCTRGGGAELIYQYPSFVVKQVKLSSYKVHPRVPPPQLFAQCVRCFEAWLGSTLTDDLTQHCSSPAELDWWGLDPSKPQGFWALGWMGRPGS